jgi:uncharacterized protein YndB with AHSA1/START domain
MTSRGTTPASELVVRLRRVLPPSRERVYDALTNPVTLATLVGPNGFTCPSIEFEPRVGDGYRIAMQPPEGELFHLTGEFRECRRQSVLRTRSFGSRRHPTTTRPWPSSP